jgi:hypothetical protein
VVPIQPNLQYSGLSGYSILSAYVIFLKMIILAGVLYWAIRVKKKSWFRKG